MAAPAVIQDLVGRFAEHRERYHSGQYDEAQLRQEFLNPFFETLGWDVDNKKGCPDAYKEVIHEAAIKIGGRTKAPDYCFRVVGGRPSFFVEAKKPAVDIGVAISPAYQLRRYAWSAKLPISILTDFEELAVYDCRIRPAKNDKPATGRILFCTFEEYLARWDELEALLSPEAIRRGALDRFVASQKVKKGTAEVDIAFLAEIESWRDLLARNIANRNPELSQRDLNFAVQRTIDRIVFLRICEDRGIEPYGGLQALSNGAGVYRRLTELFQRADERYNSGLFHFSPEKDRDEAPDELTLGLGVDDKPLKEVIGGLYYPESPYEFSVLPTEILGQVYEQFLGKVIRLTKGHQAKVEEKPEVRKAGGVYYTPTFIVDYIVGHTVGRLLEGKSPAQASKLRILDPACGSGSFLIGAYQYLLDWHRDTYVADGPEKHARGRNPKLYRGPAGEWRLTTAERKRILLNNIYGVDIDPQAVEVSKLSLLLKVLEGESKESVNNQLRLFHERALPDLGQNIKCGNSLVEPDVFEQRQLSILDDEQVRCLNAFDWSGEFRDVFAGRQPGFDAVIGNPPYVRMETFKPLKDYLRTHYAAHEERADLYAYFLERSLQLLRDGGTLGMIVSNKFIKAKYGRPLRELLTTKAHVETVADFAGANVFVGATVRTVVLVLDKSQGPARRLTRYVPVPDSATVAAFAAGQLAVEDHARQASYSLAEDALRATAWQLAPASHAALLAKLKRNTTPLSAWAGLRALFGLKTGMNEAFIVDHTTRAALIRAHASAGQILKPILFGRDVRRYRIEQAERYVIYCHPEQNIDEYPSVRDYLAPRRKQLQQRAGNQRWYELQQPAVALLPKLNAPKIVYPIIANECRFAIDRHGYLINDKLFVLLTDDAALVGLLNSRVANFYFSAVCAALEGAGDRYLEFRAQYVGPFPIPAGLADPQVRETLSSLALKNEELHRRLATERTPHQQTTVARQIGGIDRQIDSVVYELYGLSEKEIRVVEEATAP